MPSRPRVPPSIRRRPSFRRSMAFLPSKPSIHRITPSASRAASYRSDPFGPSSNNSSTSTSTTTTPGIGGLKISAPLEASHQSSPTSSSSSSDAAPPLPALPPAMIPAPLRRPTRPVRSSSLAAPSPGVQTRGMLHAMETSAQQGMPTTPGTPVTLEMAKAEAVPIRRFARLGPGLGDFCEVGDL